MDGEYNNPQMADAVQLYETVRQFYGDGADIILTGHSLGGALAGFVAGLFGQHAELVDPISFTRALNSFYSDMWSNASGLQETFENFGINPSQILAFNIANVYGSYLNGSIATLYHDEMPLVEALNGYNFNYSIDPIVIHGANMNVIFNYDELLSQTLGDSAKAWMAIANPAFGPNPFLSSLDNSTIADELGVGSQSQLLTMIAYSAIDTGTAPFGDTAIRAMFDDANDLGRAFQSANASDALGLLSSGISNTLVTYAGYLAKSEIADDANALSGVVNYVDQGPGLVTVDFGTAKWGSEDMSLTASYDLLDTVFEFAALNQNGIPLMDLDQFDAVTDGLPYSWTPAKTLAQIGVG